MILVLSRILAIVKINSAVMKVIIRRFRRSPFLVEKIECWILHSFIIWQNDPWFWMASLKMHRIFINSINNTRYGMLLFLVPTIIRIETCLRSMARDRLWYIVLSQFFLPEIFLQSGLLIFCLSLEGKNFLSFFSWWILLYVDP